MTQVAQSNPGQTCCDQGCENLDPSQLQPKHQKHHWLQVCVAEETWGLCTRYKVHLVAQGFSQWEGINYSETFAPVIKSASLCMFLAICAQHGWLIHQMDIKSTYLNGLITEDIYMRQLVGYNEKGSETKVAKLQRGLYRLKQVGCEWYATLHDFLI